MITKNQDQNRHQIQMFCMDDLVPQDHLLRLIDRAIDWSFIYDLVQEKYSPDFGRPGIDPVVLIKIPFIQYLYRIRSMRQTIKEIEVNVAYRWFLGLELQDPVPHFSTFGKNYTRRFKDSDLFEQIFARILSECYQYKLVDPKEVFVDATHVKARANNKRVRRRIAYEEAKVYEDQLKKEIDADREEHGKKPFKDQDGPGNGGGGEKKRKSRKVPQIRKADGSTKGSTNRSLHMEWKRLVISMDGFLDTAYIQATSTTAPRSLFCMRRSKISVWKP